MLVKFEQIRMIQTTRNFELFEKQNKTKQKSKQKTNKRVFKTIFDKTFTPFWNMIL